MCYAVSDSDEMNLRIADMPDEALKTSEEDLPPRGLVEEPTTFDEKGTGDLYFQDASRQAPGSKPESVSGESGSSPRLLHMATARGQILATR